MNWNWSSKDRAPGGGTSRRGGALLWVLVALAVALGAVIFYLNRQRAPIALLSREQKHRQAFYLAEAGLALQLHRERWFDSAQRAGERGEAARMLDSIRFFLDSAAPPAVESNRERAFLEIRSAAAAGPESSSILARFGRALDAEIFGAALSLANQAPLRPFPPGQVRGSLRLKTPSPGVASQPLPAGFPGPAYGDAYVDAKYRALEGRIREILAQEGAEPGNGDFTESFPPPFAVRPQIGFPLGDVTLRHDGENYWEISGPAAIASRHGIRVRGKLLLKDVTLLTEGDAVFEGEVRAENVTVFAAGRLALLDRARLEGLLIAGGDLAIRDRAEVAGNSLVLRSGGGSPGDTARAIRVEGEAAVSAMVLASGPAGKIVIGSSRNRIAGVLMAAEVWPAGIIQGSVVAARLRCGPGDAEKNCLGDAVIDREALPDGFSQPWDLGAGEDRSNIRFRLLAWEVR